MLVTKNRLAILAMGAAIGAVHAGDKGEKVEKKNVTVIKAESSADGGSEVRRELTRDCIVSLPDPDKLEAQVSSEPVFVHDLNGEAGRNEWIKAYTARLEVNYLNEQKELLIITTRSVQGQEPVVKEVEKKLKRTEGFVSDPTAGDSYAGRSHREYYFTKPEDAIKDVKARAKVWVQAQAAVVCPEK